MFLNFFYPVICSPQCKARYFLLTGLLRHCCMQRWTAFFFFYLFFSSYFYFIFVVKFVAVLTKHIHFITAMEKRKIYPPAAPSTLARFTLMILHTPHNLDLIVLRRLEAEARNALFVPSFQTDCHTTCPSDCHSFYSFSPFSGHL